MWLLWRHKFKQENPVYLYRTEKLQILSKISYVLSDGLFHEKQNEFVPNWTLSRNEERIV